jgi:signal transduction histidine kinase
MSQQSATVQAPSDALHRLQVENAQLQRYLAAQKSVILSLERRAGRSLESMGVHVKRLSGSAYDSAGWHQNLESVQHELDCLCDLISDTMILQKLEAGKVDFKLAPLDLKVILQSISRHLLDPKDGTAVRFVSKVDSTLPIALADQDLTEAVLTDLLARGLKYSDPSLPVVLEAEQVGERVHLYITAQRFAPPGNRDFAMEISLCCRRVEVQGGEVTCQPHPDGLQTVTIALRIAPDSSQST